MQEPHFLYNPCLNQQDSVQTAIVLGVVGDLGITAPDDFAACSDETQFANVDLNNGTLGEDTELRIPGKG
jgi:hypothetical protein